MLQTFDSKKEVILYRRLLLTAAVAYLGWWFAIDLVLPQAFNPFVSRLVVVLCILAPLGASFFHAWTARHLRWLFLAAIWLITLHYYYLFYENGGDANWVIGSYITVIAITLCLFSTLSLLSYSVFVLTLSSVMLYLLPTLRDAIFLPGLVTILAQSFVSLRARMSVFKNLLDSNARFQLLFHSTFDGILVHENGRILNANESMSEISGFSRDELIGKSVLDILVPEERAIIAAKLSQEEVPPYETKGRRKDGRTIDVEVRAKSFQYDGKPARLVTIQDISDRKKAEHERIKALTLVENLRVRDEFISIASHELKTPISSLKLQTQMIEQDLKESQALNGSVQEIDEIISLFNRQIDRLTELVEAMLDVSRISAGRFVLDMGEVDFADLVRQTVKLLSIHNASTGAPPISVEAPEHLTVRGDRRRLQQVIENLLSNAIKYGDGKPIAVRLTPEEKGVLLMVQDHGLGIGTEFLPRIFDRFERGVSARNISGLGLGLYITKQIVESHGGVISVASELGTGSVFTAQFPDGVVL